MYIELESLRFDESFHFEIGVDENLSNDIVFVPSLMIQPFAETGDVGFHVQPHPSHLILPDGIALPQ